MSLIRKSPLEFSDQIASLYRRGLPPGASTGWPSVDEFYTVEKGQWTVITGVPGHGKSEFLDAMMINLAMSGWQFVIFSPENQPHELHISKLIEKWTNKPFRDGPTPRMSEGDLADTVMDLAARFVFLTVDSEFAQQPSLQTVLDSASFQIDEWRKHGSGERVGVVIDPWNEMDHSRPSNFSETEYISQCLSMVRQFARDWEIHVFLVAHPTKISKDKEGKYPVARLWDISGSAHWNNKADNGITVHRDVLDRNSPVQIHVLKVRFKNIGKPGLILLNYDRVTGRYLDPRGSTLKAEESRKMLAAGDIPCPI